MNSLSRGRNKTAFGLAWLAKGECASLLYFSRSFPCFLSFFVTFSWRSLRPRMQTSLGAAPNARRRISWSRPSSRRWCATRALPTHPLRHRSGIRLISSPTLETPTPSTRDESLRVSRQATRGTTAFLWYPRPPADPALAPPPHPLRLLPPLPLTRCWPPAVSPRPLPARPSSTISSRRTRSWRSPLPTRATPATCPSTASNSRLSKPQPAQWTCFWNPPKPRPSAEEPPTPASATATGAPLARPRPPRPRTLPTPSKSGGTKSMIFTPETSDRFEISGSGGASGSSGSSKLSDCLTSCWANAISSRCLDEHTRTWETNSAWQRRRL